MLPTNGLIKPLIRRHERNSSDEDNSDDKIVTGNKRPLSAASATSSSPASRRATEIRTMYIQMEFCDKQTLRTAIDEGLYKNVQRVWRMFRVRSLRNLNVIRRDTLYV